MTIQSTSRYARLEKGTKMNFMFRWGRLGLAAYALSGVWGCAGQPATVSNSSSDQSITFRQVPDVPGCDAVTAEGSFRTVGIEGQPGLYLVIKGEKPLCIDDSAGLTALNARSLANVNSSAIDVADGEADSDPMPCHGPDISSSNPMPIKPPGEVDPPGGTDPIQQKH
jgi:hypothetical protein